MSFARIPFYDFLKKDEPVSDSLSVYEEPIEISGSIYEESFTSNEIIPLELPSALSETDISYSTIPFIGSFNSFVQQSKRISELPPVIELSSTDVFAVVNEGETRKVTLSQLTVTLTTILSTTLIASLTSILLKPSLSAESPFLSEYSGVCLGVTLYLNESPPPTLNDDNIPLSKTEMCLGINAKLIASPPPPDPLVLPENPNVCIDINARLLDAGAFVILIDNTSNAEKTNVCLDIKGRLVDAGAFTVIDEQRKTNVCLDIKGRLVDAGTFNVIDNTNNPEKTNVCLDIKGSLVDEIASPSFLNFNQSGSLCSTIFTYITDINGIINYWVGSPPTAINKSWLIYAPTGITGTNNTKDYIILTDDFLSFRLWNPSSSSFVSVSFETFLNNRLTSGVLPDRCIEIENNIFNFTNPEKFVLTFEQGTGQTSNSIGAFLIHPSDQGTVLHIVEDDQTVYEVFPIGGKTDITTPAMNIEYDSIQMKIYRLLLPQSPEILPVTIQIQPTI